MTSPRAPRLPTPDASLPAEQPEPWDIAAAREHGLRDWLAIAALGLGAMLLALVPPARLVVLTALRLSIAALLASLSLIAPALAGEACAWAARAFVLLALLSLAAHIEGATLGPLVDRLVGRDRP